MTGEGTLPVLDDTAMTALPLLDPQTVEWSRVQRTAFLVHQHLRYEYPGPVEDLRQRLVIFPPEVHGDQHRVMHRLRVSTPLREPQSHQDEFGNVVVDLCVPRVDQVIDFEAWVVVERSLRRDPSLLPVAVLSDPRLLTPSPLTRPGPLLERAARELRATGCQGLALAEQITTWVYRSLSYAHDVTDIGTTAEEALALGRGVCQDYAQVMAALCRLCNLPARYVSGHLLGEGGTHAWVEVLLPHGAEGAVAWPFDPTHDRRAGLSYVTIAVGRDYGDVAPTSGTFRATYRGRLSTRKSVDLTEVEYVTPDPAAGDAA